MSAAAAAAAGLILAFLLRPTSGGSQKGFVAIDSDASRFNSAELF